MWVELGGLVEECLYVYFIIEGLIEMSFIVSSKSKNDLIYLGLGASFFLGLGDVVWVDTGK